MVVFLAPVLAAVGGAILGSSVSNSIKAPLDDMIGEFLPTQDAPLRATMAAASVGVITIAELEASSAFQKLQESDKRIVVAIVKGKRKADRDDALSRAAVEARKTAEKIVGAYDDEVFKPYIKQLDALEDVVLKAEKDYKDLILDREEFYARLDIDTITSAVNALENRANRAELIA